MRLASTLFATALTIASAWVLYAEGSATRRLEAQVQAAERQRERLESEITILKAERAWLARPGRIEPAAKALGLRAPVAGEHVELETLLDGGGSDGTERRR